MKAKVNKIIPFSSVDGPGNRTVIFFQECNFNCLYCHNPETINICNNCGKCIFACKFEALKFIENHVFYDSEKCENCDECIKICKNNSSPKNQNFTVNELINIINKTKLFISGITISGGECTVQFEFLLKFLQKTHDLKISTFIDTNAYLSVDKMLNLSEYFDKAMIDFKWFDNKIHKKLTGKSNEIVLQNIDLLIQKEKVHEIRTVVFPFFDDYEQNIQQIAKYIAERNPDLQYKLIKFRKNGVRNSDKYFEPNQNIMLNLKEKAENEGCRNVIIV